MFKDADNFYEFSHLCYQIFSNWVFTSIEYVALGQSVTSSCVREFWNKLRSGTQIMDQANMWRTISRETKNPYN